MARKSKRIAAVEVKPPMQENIYNAAVYTRLSVEDTKYKNGSDSLVNQRELIFDYLKDKPNMKVYSVYCDNGASGTNFDREDFQRMMYDIYNGNVNCVIVKDLSRFGREYIESGDYLERIFPLLGIRFIAINDNYDNQVNPFNISVPIKNIINTLYARDLSKKSAAALRMKQAQGEFIGSFAPYGYRKSPEDKHKLIIDEETAPIVRMIFEWKADGMGSTAIIRKLYEMKIMPPMRYRYDKGIIKDKRYEKKEFWTWASIKGMLRNEVYIGNLVQGRRKSRFYDGMKEEFVDKKDWIVVKNTHEPIVSKELFDKVQEIMDESTAAYHRNSGKNAKIGSNENLLRGKVVCGDCGTKFTWHKRVKQKTKKVYYNYICPHHAQFPNDCDFISVSANILKEITINSIRVETARLTDLERAIENVSKSQQIKKKISAVARETSDILSGIAYIKKSRIKSSSDYAKGILSDEEYMYITAEFDSELKAAAQRLEAVNKQREKLNTLLSAKQWIADLKKYKNGKKLTQEMVDAFIKQITVYSDKRIEIEFTYSDKENELLSLFKGGESRE